MTQLRNNRFYISHLPSLRHWRILSWPDSWEGSVSIYWKGQVNSAALHSPCLCASSGMPQYRKSSHSVFTRRWEEVVVKSPGYFGWERQLWETFLVKCYTEKLLPDTSHSLERQKVKVKREHPLDQCFYHGFAWSSLEPCSQKPKHMGLTLSQIFKPGTLHVGGNLR